MTENQPEDPHPARSLSAVDAPLDSATQSLAEALRTSFRILKFAMIVLVILFLSSGAFIVEQSEQAVVLRLGSLTTPVREAGLCWAFPYPIDEVLKLPVKQSSPLAIDSHWFFVRDRDKGKSVRELSAGRRGLHPTRDGALLTGDKGLVHVKWRLTYRIDDLNKYITNVADADTEIAEQLITRLLENAAIHVVGGFTTEDATRKRLTDLRNQVKIMVNSELERLGTGIVVERVEIPESTPPLQTRVAFDQVLRAENNKLTAIREAEQSAADLLNATAGASYTQLVSLLDEYDAAEASGDSVRTAQLTRQIDKILDFEASGEVGSAVREAKSYFTTAVQQMRGDVEQYEALLPEYLKQPELLMSRMWEQTRQRVLEGPDVIRNVFPHGTQIRIHISPNPKQRELREQRRYEEESGNLQHGSARPHIVFPGGVPQ